jgi:hypothetical protein
MGSKDVVVARVLVERRNVLILFVVSVYAALSND